jgi:hypothetical protein
VEEDHNGFNDDKAKAITLFVCLFICKFGEEGDGEEGKKKEKEVIGWLKVGVSCHFSSGGGDFIRIEVYSELLVLHYGQFGHFNFFLKL